MSGGRFRLLTFNTLFRPAARARLRAIAPIINGSGIEIVCLQEVIYRANASLLKRELTLYEPPAAHRFGIWCVGGLVTFSRVPIRKTSYGVFERRGQWRSHGAADRLLRKGFLITAHEIEGVSVVVINTHLLANYDQDWSARNRFARDQEAELTQLSDAIATTSHESLVIVAGDLNVPAGSDMFQRFVRTSGLVNAFGARNSPDTLRPLPSGGPGFVIDHILYRPASGVRVECDAQTMLEAAVDLGRGRTAFPSDHIGVCATFII